MIEGINGIHHVCLCVPDFEAARRFYVDLLGFEICLERSWPKGTAVMDTIQGIEDSAGEVLLLRCGSNYIEIFHYFAPIAKTTQDPQRPTYEPGLVHIAFDVNGLPSLYERLLAAGVKFNSPPVERGSHRTCYCRDPFGNYLEMQEIHANSILPKVGELRVSP